MISPKHNSDLLANLLRAGLCGITEMMLLVGPQSARATVYTASGTDSAGAIDATANVTVSGNYITVVLTNLEQNPAHAGQMVSGIQLMGISGGELEPAKAATSQISTNGKFTSPVTSSLTAWKLTESHDVLSLATAGSQMIVGADSKGNFNAVGGLYSDAANWVTGKSSPFVLGTATFTIYDPGVTAKSITGVKFDFGPYPDDQSAGSPSDLVPEPSAFIVWSVLAAGAIGLTAWRRRGRNRSWSSYSPA